MTTRLTGSEQGKLAEAMRLAMPTESDWRMFLFLRFDKQLDSLALGRDLQQIVFRLLFKVNNEGWIESLIDGAVQEFSHVEELVQLAETLRRPETASRPTLPMGPGLAANLEKIVNDGSSFTHVTEFYERIRLIGQWVCRVTVPNGGGSGFLIGPDLVLTNFHVIEDLLGSGQDLGQIACHFDFHHRSGLGVIEKGRKVAVDGASVPPSRPYSPGDLIDPPTRPAAIELDYAILRLVERVGDEPAGSNPPVGAPNRGFLQLRRSAASPRLGEPIFVFQHPKPKVGEQMPMQVTLGTVSDCDWPKLRMRYNADTMAGSSGSPIFDASLRLVGLHHAGDPAWVPAFNQGIPVPALVQDLVDRKSELAAAGLTEPWS